MQSKYFNRIASIPAQVHETGAFGRFGIGDIDCRWWDPTSVTIHNRTALVGVNTSKS